MMSSEALEPWRWLSKRYPGQDVLLAHEGRNLVFRVAGADGVCGIKVAKAGSPPGEVAREGVLRSFLADGTPLVELGTLQACVAFHGLPAVAWRWDEGRTLREAIPVESAVEGLASSTGRALANGHAGLEKAAAASAVPFPQKGPGVWAIPRFLRIRGSKTPGQRVVAEAGSRLWADLPALWADWKRNSTICHGDFHLDNVLLTSSDQVRVLDWEFASVGDPAVDVGMMVGEVLGHAVHHAPGAHASASSDAAWNQVVSWIESFESAYLTERQLQDDFRQRARVHAAFELVSQAFRSDDEMRAQRFVELALALRQTATGKGSRELLLQSTLVTQSA